MVKRWIGYLTVWLCCLIFYLLHRQWAAFMILAAVTALPILSVLLTVPILRNVRVRLPQVSFVTQGDQVPLDITVTSQKMIPLWDTKIALYHSFSGNRQSMVPGQRLPTDHCGMLEISVGYVYIYDYLGVLRFAVAKPQQLSIAVRPEPVAPETLPELGRRSSSRWRPRRGGGFSENHELRLYRPGDNLQQIHWKLSAKTGALILREPMEPEQNHLVLRLELTGDANALDSKLSRLLWLSQYLLARHLNHRWQVLTAEGPVDLSIQDEDTLLSAMDSLLRCAPAREGSVLRQPSGAAWWYYIGGDSHEES